SHQRFLGHQHNRADEPPEQGPQTNHDHDDDVDELRKLQRHKCLETEIEQARKKSFGLNAVGARSTLGRSIARIVVTWIIRVIWRLLSHRTPLYQGSRRSRVVSVKNVPRAQNNIPELSRFLF